jgi:hypothetical protein
VNDGIWIVVGIAAVAFTVLREAGSLLSRIGSADGVGYGTSVFTGPNLALLRTDDLAAALALWSGTQPEDGTASDVALAGRLLGIHVIADLVFIAAYSVVLWRLLRWVGAGRSFAVGAPLVMAAADYAETVLFGIAVARDGGAPTVLLVAIQLFSAVKWSTLIVIIVGAIVNLFRDDRRGRSTEVVGFEQSDGRSIRDPDGPDPPTTEAGATASDEATTDETELSTKKIIQSVQAARTYGELPAPIAVTGQLVVIGIFSVLIALPGGSALAQVPDVLRVQIDPIVDGNAWPDGRPFVMSTLALALFALSAVASAVIGGPVPSPRRKTIGTAIPLTAALLVSALLAVLGQLFDGSGTLSPWASVVVVGTVGVAAWIATLATGDRAEDVTRSESIPSQWETRTGPESVGGGPPNSLVSAVGLSLWASALAALIVIAGGIGLLRAAAPIVMLGDRSRWWWLFAAVAVVVVVTGGVAAQRILSTGVVPRILTGNRHRRLALGTTIVAVVVALAGWLAVDPAAARYWGTTGATAIAFSLYVLVIGGLQRLARRGRPWRATQRLGFGVTTPWAFLLFMVWVVGSLLNVKPGYHDIDLLPPDVPASAETTTERSVAGRHRSVGTAFNSWLDTNERVDCGANEPIPLVLVAAPGGGIRAAYWTGTTLEDLLPGPCRNRLFMASGTSGGAVGIAVWASATSEPGFGSSDDASLAGADSAGPTIEALTAMSRDDPLAATVASLLLRDLPQPFTGLRTAWDDRAAVLEQRWVEVTATAADGSPTGGVFGRPGAPRPMDDLGALDDGWAPIVVLNSASVIDGCRALVTTLDSQPTVGGGDCLATTPVLAQSMMPETNQPVGGDTSTADQPDVGDRVAGPSGASIDVLDRLTVDTIGCEASDRVRPDLAIVSGALMAARWPYITPSGSTRYCVNGQQRELYVVDGGYFENTGLLAVLEVWNELGPLVAAHNTDPGNRPIVPWILFLDNSYRQNEPPTVASRPPELLVPLRTFFQNQVAGPAALQQEAAAAMSRFAPSDDCTDGGYTRLGPEASPEVAAPLGWVLSEASRDSLDGFRRDAIASDDTCLTALTDLLGVRSP